MLTAKEIHISLKYKNEGLLIFLKESNVLKENIEERSSAAKRGTAAV